jgi:hypothetical protein
MRYWGERGDTNGCGRGVKGLETKRKLDINGWGNSKTQEYRKAGSSRKRGAMGRGHNIPEMILCGGNKGGKMEKDGRGRVEERGEPSMAAPVQTGHLDQMMCS